MKKLVTLALAAVLTLCAALCLTAPASAASEKYFNGEVTYTESSSSLSGGELWRRTYSFTGGDSVELLNYAPSGASRKSVVLASFPIGAALPGGGVSGASLRYYDSASAKWVVTPVAEGVYSASMVYIKLAVGSYMIYTPTTWREIEQGTRELIADSVGYVSVRKSGSRYVADVVAPAPPDGCETFLLYARSPGNLVEWSRGAETFWRPLLLDGDSRFCSDGYYRPTPSTYNPHGENYYFRCTASYYCKGLAAGADEYRAAKLLLIASSDTMLRKQNSDGCWPTAPASDWLYNDYGIGAGFYDTRWNSDFVDILVSLYSDYGGLHLRAALGRYADFFVEYASSHHTATRSGGWLVADYGGASGASSGEKPAHTSLNHQLAEIITLYKLSSALSRPELSSLAGKLLLAVDDTAGGWIKPDGDLWYSVSAAGKYGGSDYPYLTYNDLVHLQALLPEPNAGIAKLADSKRRWMDSHGVTGYEKQSQPQ